MARGPILTVHAWDPYHGDRNNRHPRLGAPVPRRVPADLWRTFTSIQPAIHNNGIYGWTNHLDSVDAMTRREERVTGARKHEAAKARRNARELASDRVLMLKERHDGALIRAKDQEALTIAAEQLRDVA